jgi:phage terminase Nu1 subunit (DNA packaging protein)
MALTPKPLTRTELAAVYGVHPLTITSWQEAGMPVHQRGARGRASVYSLPDVNAWWLTRELGARAAGHGNGHGPLSPQAEKAALDRARRQELEHRLAKLKGATMPVREHEQQLIALVVQARTAFLALHSKLAHRFALSRDVVLGIDQEVRQILEDLAGDSEIEPNDNGNGTRP